MASSSSRHPFVLLGAAASLITVLSFFGIRGWPGSEPPAPAPPSATAIVPISSTSPAPAPSPTCTCADRTTPAPAPVSCVIEDRLGDGDLTEAVRLAFGSKEWQLTVDETNPTARLTLTFPHAGSYGYSVQSETETSDGETLRGSGDGTISCRGGQTFELVVADYESDPLAISLSEV